MAGAFDIFVAYKFIKILVTPWEKTDAYKLGIIDDEGNLLKKRKDLKTGKEKIAYTIIHTLIWNLKRLLDKIPVTKTKLGSFAAALWLLKEKLRKDIKESTLLEDSFISYIDIEIPPNDSLVEMFVKKGKIREGTYMARSTLPLIYDFINTKDSILVENANPEGIILGTPVFSGEHRNTGKRIVFSHEDILRIS